MKKLIFILLTLLSFASIAQDHIQPETIKLEGLIYNTKSGAVDTLISVLETGQFKVKNVTDPVDSLDAVNYRTLLDLTGGDVVHLTDSTILYVTPKMLMDSIATLAGGHDPVTLSSTATAAGMTLSVQQLSQAKASNSQNGYLDKYDFYAFSQKLGTISHDLFTSGLGTVASPLTLDTAYLKTYLNAIYLTPTGNLTGTFNGQNAAYYLEYTNFTNAPTVSTVPYGGSWVGSMDLVPQDVLYTAISTISGTTTNLSYLPFIDKGIMTSSTGNGDTIPVVETYAGLMEPTDKIRLDDISTVTLADGLKIGGNVTWTSGLTFAITTAVYYIGGKRYQTTEESVTLDAADATNGRRDVIALDTLNNAIVIKGTAAANPQKPTIDPQSHIELTDVLLLANDTIPSQPSGDSIINVIVYDENTEWTGSSTGVTVDFADTSNPYTGTVNASVGTIEHKDEVSFTGTSVSSFTTLSLRIKLKATINSQQYLYAFLTSSGNSVSNSVNLGIASTTNYQLITLTSEQFDYTGTFDGITLLWIDPNVATHSGFYLDRVVLQTGVEQPNPLQQLITDGTAGNISISDGNTVTINVNDADADSTNELQTLSLNGNNLVISDGNEVDLGLIIPDSTNYWSKTEITEADTTLWGTDASTTNELITGVSYTSDTLTITEAGTAHKVKIVASTGGDDWGTQTVVSDASLTGGGTIASPLSVVDSEISITATQVSDFDTEVANNTAVTANIAKVTNATHTGEVTGDGALTIADNVVDYANVDETLKDSLVNNTLTWDISASGIIYCTPSTGTVSFTNKQKNKNVVVVLTLSSATITWPTEAKILEGSATLGDGTFYVFIQCISDSIVLVSITKEAA